MHPLAERTGLEPAEPSGFYGLATRSVYRSGTSPWSREGDSNPRPLGYEPSEQPLLHPAKAVSRKGRQAKAGVKGEAPGMQQPSMHREKGDETPMKQVEWCLPPRAGYLTWILRPLPVARLSRLAAPDEPGNGSGAGSSECASRPSGRHLSAFRPCR